MKALDLFAGVGGMSLGFRQSGFEIVYANEYDPQIAEAYAYNHPGTTVDTRDIRKIDFQETFTKYKGEVAVVVGGPPCQGFSQKGKRIGLQDERNFMFRLFFKVIEVVEPEFVVLENVPNIFTAAGGHFRNEVIQEFEKLGYKVECKVLRAENFGIPQMRRRAIFLARKGKTPPPLPEGNGKRVSVSEAISDLPRLESGGGTEFASYGTEPQSAYQLEMRKNCKTVTNHISTAHSSISLERLGFIRIGDTRDVLPKEHLTKSIHSGTWTRIPNSGFARTITTRFDTPSSGQFTLEDQDRCITVREAARIQSFPDTFKFLGSKSSQMLQVGNAVPPKLAEVIANVIRDNM